MGPSGDSPSISMPIEKSIKTVRVQTTPKRYGVRPTAYFTAVCLHIAYVLSVIPYFTDWYNSYYNYFTIAFVVIGIACA